MLYNDFLQSKRLVSKPAGFDVPLSALNPALFPFQRDIVRWACKRGRAAIFSDCGTGKSIMELSWSDQVARHTNQPVLILTPAAVSRQTVEEAIKFGFIAQLCSSSADVIPGINVTNYEKLHKFDASVFGGVSADESSILKAYDGKTRNQILDAFGHTPYRLACTATAAPNDFMELGNHAQYLGVMSYNEMLATFFVHDGGGKSKLPGHTTSQEWRLKGHAVNEFWKWVASWAVLLRRPSDLGYSDEGFVLPVAYRHQHEVTIEHQAEVATDGAQMYLFAVEAKSLIERRNARKVSMVDRVEAVRKLVYGA